MSNKQINKNKIKKNNSGKLLKLKEDNKALKNEIDSLKNKNILLLAEFNNYKRRIINERVENKKYEGKDIFNKVIPIIDDIDRILNLKSADAESLINGIDLIKNKFLSILNDYGIDSYDSLGENFDPDYHEAIMTKKTKKKSNIVIEEYQKGYTYHDKVLRHAKVIVSE